MEKDKNILIVLTRSPYPIIDGTRQHVLNDVIKNLAQNYSLDLLLISNEDFTEESRKFLSQYFSKIDYFHISKPLFVLNSLKSLFSGRPLQTESYFIGAANNFLQGVLGKYDAVYLHTIRLGKYLENIKSKGFSNIFLDYNDAISLNYKSAKTKAQFPWNLIYAFEEKRVAREEIKMLGLTNLASIVSDKDRDYLLNKKPEYKDKLFCIVPRLEPVIMRENYEKSSKLIFLGNINYPPNKDALINFAENIFPSVIKKESTLRLVVVGNGAQDINFPEIVRNNIDVLGFVDDLSSVLNSNNILVVPIRFGAGLPSKISNALAYGTTVIASPLAAASVATTDLLGSGIICLDNEKPEIWAEEISDLINNKKRLAVLAHAAHKFAEDNYNRELDYSKVMDIIFRP